MRLHLWRYRPRGSEAYRDGWRRVADEPTARWAVPAIAFVAYPAAYFAGSFALRGTAIAPWLWQTESGAWLRGALFVLMWVWMGFAPGIVKRLWVRRVLKVRRRQWRCLVCAYSLREVPAAEDGGRRCPECGTWHDASDLAIAG